MEEKFNIEKIIGFEALYESSRKCQKGVIWKESVATYRLNRIERTMNLSKQLKDGTYRAMPLNHFRITSPKPREIASVAFRDRVYQRSLNDNIVYPVMTNSFIYDNFACQTGKGTDAARERLKEFLHWHYRRFGADGYVAQFDIHGYYPNMDHAVAEKTFQEKLCPEVFDMTIPILRQQNDGQSGYFAGSQLIQIAGISVLNKMDHFIKEKLRAKLYIRYMDDFLIISNDRQYLEHCMKKVVEHLTSLRLEINEKKTRIYPLREGIEFLGFTFRLTKTGKVLMQIKSENVKRQRKKLRRMVKQSKAGKVSREKVDQSYQAWRNHAEKGNSFKLLQRMDAYYACLWKEKT